MTYLTHRTDYIPDAINRHFVISFWVGFLVVFFWFCFCFLSLLLEGGSKTSSVESAVCVTPNMHYTATQKQLDEQITPWLIKEQSFQKQQYVWFVY